MNKTCGVCCKKGDSMRANDEIRATKDNISDEFGCPAPLSSVDRFSNDHVM